MKYDCLFCDFTVIAEDNQTALEHSIINKDRGDQFQIQIDKSSTAHKFERSKHLQRTGFQSVGDSIDIEY
jgi:hypothetical protein